MKESIYTIPISEVFEPKRGCPVCALREALETRWVQYITGAAMMEPDVRRKTNEEGFCARHLSAMLGQRNRLSVALLLQTRLQYVMDHLEEKPGGGGFGRKKAPPADSCFVCGRVEGELTRLAGNIAAVWAREESFRALYGEQECLCVPHHRLLIQAAGELRGARREEFRRQTNALAMQGLTAAKMEIDAFCGLFDHRSGSGAQPDSAVGGAIEEAAKLLCDFPDFGFFS